MSRPILLLAMLSVFALAVPIHAQEPLAVTWSSAERWLQADGRRESEASDPGALRGRASQGACRSTVTAGNDLPVVVRFDSTETTLMGRGAAVVSAVAAFPGSAWDVTDPAAPRRLNLLLRESPAGVPDTAWTPGAPNESLLVMTSSYDGTGTAYAGRNLALHSLDCLYALALAPVAGGATPTPVEMDVRPARVWPLSAYPPAGPGAAGTDLTWTYDGPAGATVRVRRVARGQETERTVALLPASARTFTDSGTAPDTLYRYRVEVVDGEGRRLAASARSALVRRYGTEGLTLRGTLNVGRWARDVWGYVGPDGREYALLNAEGLTVIDVTDPAAPVEIAHIPGGYSDIEAYGHYVYVTGDNNPVQVIDIADPTAPVLVGQFWGHPDDPMRGVHTLSIVDGRMYLNGNVQGFTVWSLADPAEPSYLGAYRGGYTHDLLVRSDTVYAALIYGGGVHVVDVSNPTQPALMTTFNYPGSGAHNVCSTADGRYLFVGDEIGTAGRWTRVFDVSDLDNVELVAEIVVNAEATVHNCHRVGDRLFIGHYTEGVRVWNIADPTQPVEVAFYNDPLLGVSDTSPTSGIWTVWPHLPSGTLLASNYKVASGSPGLLLFTLTEGVDTEPAPVAVGPALRLAPNPTTGDASALVTLDASATVGLAVYDVLGRRVARLAEADLGAGSHRLSVPTGALPAGVYAVRLSVDGRPAGTRTLTVAR